MPIGPALPAGLTDEEAAAAIGLTFADVDPTPLRRSERGPRDDRPGDRWLPWPFETSEEVR